MKRFNEAEAIAGLLHDSVEDQAHRFGGVVVLRDLLRDSFGNRVVEIVDACTDSETNPRPPLRELKGAFLTRVSHVADSVTLVESCDKPQNKR